MTRRRRLFVWAGIAVVITASAADHAGVFGWHGVERDRYANIEATITRVVEGDIVEIDIPDADSETTRVRLLGIDCPNVGAPPAIRDAYFAREAFDFTRHQLLGRRVRIVLDPYRRIRDTDGQLLAYLYPSDTGEPVNADLIEHGLAFADGRREHVLRYAFGQKEANAIKIRAGLWKNVTADQLPEWRRQMPPRNAR